MSCARSHARVLSVIIMQSKKNNKQNKRIHTNNLRLKKSFTSHHFPFKSLCLFESHYHKPGTSLARPKIDKNRIWKDTSCVSQTERGTRFATDTRKMKAPFGPHDMAQNPNQAISSAVYCAHVDVIKESTLGNAISLSSRTRT